MDDKELQEKLDKIVKIAQSQIVAFLEVYVNSDVIEQVKDVFNKYPITFEKMDIVNNGLGKTTRHAGHATDIDISINKQDIINCDLKIQYEVDEVVGTIIHEYAHQFRKINSQYGEMFEEGFMNLFAEACINYNKAKSQEQQLMFQVSSDDEYKKAESQIRALLYGIKLKHGNADIKLMIEYVLGSEKRFKETCTQIFGTDFLSYYESVIHLKKNRQSLNDSERQLIKLLSNYIKTNNLSVRDYWNDRIVSANDLYANRSPLFSKSITTMGIEAMRPDERDLFKHFDASASYYDEINREINDSRRENIRKYISVNYALTGKTPEEIHSTLMKLISDYIHYCSLDDEESLMFIEELSHAIPNVETVKNHFKQARILGMDKKIIESMNLDNISYLDITSKFDEMLAQPREKENVEQQKPQVVTDKNQINDTYSQNNTVIQFPQSREQEILRKNEIRKQQLENLELLKANVIAEYEEQVSKGYKK